MAQRRQAPTTDPTEESGAARNDAMDLVCYLHPGWEPLIRPAEATREWMDESPEAFAYRCLPLNIANSHGWEILTPLALEARWTGGMSTDDVEIRILSDSNHDLAPGSIFGQGVLTFHIYGLFRTPPGWNLWVGGSPNRPKDGIFPLSGVIETDWSPYTFTMNWRFTRPDHWVRFEEMEPICFIFPVQRGYLEGVRPKLVPMERDPELMEQFKAWSKSRDEFQAKVARDQPEAGAAKWQKRYYRGVDMKEQPVVADHQIKPRLAAFVPGEPDPPSQQQSGGVPLSSIDPHSSDTPHGAELQRALQSVGTELMRGAETGPLVTRLTDLGMPESEAGWIVETALANPIISDGRAMAKTLRKRDWLLDVLEKHSQLACPAADIERRADLGEDEFLERYYAQNRPVILTCEMADWPAISKWTPAYLRETIGDRPVEYQGDRSQDDRFEMYKDQHRREMAFARLIDQMTEPDAGNDAYITAYNSAKNAEALSRLHGDLGFLDKFLDRNVEQPHGMMWIGPAGTVTSLHHDLTNNLIAQIVGRKRFKIVAAAEVAKVYNHHHVFSEITDLDAPDLDIDRYPALKEARVYDVTLTPGEAIFMPIGWWHQVRSLDFSVTITYTNFRWPNDAHQTYPTD